MKVKGWYPIGPSCVYNGQMLSYWSPASAVSGRVTCIVIHPTNPDIVYVGTATGGVWKTIDNGVNWTPIMDDQITLSVGAMALDHENLDRLYVATGEGNNASESLTSRGVLIYNPAVNPKWSMVGYDALKGTGIRRIIIDPRSTGLTKRILLATDRGLLESPDDGGSWNKMDVQPPLTKSVEISDIAFCKGATADEDVLLAAITGKTIYKKVRPGAFLPNPPDVCSEAKRSRIALSVCRDFPKRVYALFADSDGGVIGVYISDDAGSTWSSSPTKPFAFGMRQGNYNLQVQAHPTEKETFFMAETRLWRTTNGGSTWDNVSDSSGGAPGIHSDQHAIAISDSNPMRVWSGNDGGAWYSDDGGKGFYPRNRGLQTMQFYSLAQHADDASLLLGGTQDNGTPRYEGSPAWSLSGSGDGFFCAIDPVEKARWYSSYCFMSDGKVRAIKRSEKAGASDSWSFITDNIDNSFTDDSGKPSKYPPFYVPFIIDPTDHTRLYLGTNKLWRSDHFGDDWQPVRKVGMTEPFTTGSTADKTITAIAVTPNDGRMVWVGTYDGRVYQLEQKNGLEYEVTELTIPPTDTEWVKEFYISDLAVVKAIDPNERPALNRVYVALGSPHVGYVVGDKTAPLGRIFACDYDAIAGRRKFYRLDGNIPFRSLTGKLIGNAENPVNALVIDPDNSDRVYMGCDSGVFLTKDGGGVWEDYTGGLPNVAIGDLQFHKPTRLLRAATMGRSVWERQVDAPGDAATVDLFIRDNIVDMGMQPAPSPTLDDPFNPGAQVTAFSGADIKIDTPFLGIGSFQTVATTEDYTSQKPADYVSFQTFSCDNFRRKVKSRVYVEVMNRGPQDATACVVRAFLVPKDINNNNYGMLPQNFWAHFLTGGPGDFALWTPLGDMKPLGTIQAASPKVAMWEFDMPVDMPDTVGVVAIATCSEDPVVTLSGDIDTIAAANKRVALREVQVNMRADAIIGITLALIGLAAIGVVGGLKAGKVI
jgi:hypothetical protein